MVDYEGCKLNNDWSGIVREVWKNYISEYTINQGKKSGLKRWINSVFVYIELFNEDKRLAKFVFDHNFKETSR